jgi:hypothetical protein
MKKPVLPMVGYAQLAEALNAVSLAGMESAGELKPGKSISQAEAIAQLSDVMAILEKTQSDPGVLTSADDRMASLVQTYLARQSAVKPCGVVSTDAGHEAKFDSKDVFGWAGSLFDWIKGLKKHDFADQGGVSVDLKNKTRMALLSDWGTGMYGGPVCAQSIEDNGKFDVLLHLGDVYYSGDVDEIKDRFLKFWPQLPNTISRALNANHEMYSGGHGYFGHILPAFDQASSYFALQNDYWLLVGLDTGYSEHELHGSQASWLIELVRNAGDRRVVLFSHHQPFSLYEQQGIKLVAQLAPLLEARKIHAWYWGHEHRCVVYDVHALWGVRGRCIGHSGFPYFRDHFVNPLAEPGWQSVAGKNLVPSARVLDGPNRYVEDKPSKYGPNGYVVLEFDDRDLRERYMRPDGTELPSPVNG